MRRFNQGSAVILILVIYKNKLFFPRKLLQGYQGKADKLMASKIHSNILLSNTICNRKSLIIQTADNIIQDIFKSNNFLLLLAPLLVASSWRYIDITTMVENQCMRHTKWRNLQTHMHQHYSHNYLTQSQTGIVLRARKDMSCKEKEQFLFCI